ncbi:inner-membrane translocator [Candidatus Paraburkholderia kirkii]|nr:inner-membrane translocator [Candidatus Paraburkholderia kirkii]
MAQAPQVHREPRTTRTRSERRWLTIGGPIVFLLLWSAGFPIAKTGLHYASPLTFLSICFALSVGMLLTVCAIRRPQWPRDARAWRHLVVVGFLVQVMYFGLSYLAMTAGIATSVLVVIAGLVAAAIIGFVNGAVTVYLRLPSFVTTLGTLFLINGITLTVSRGTPVATPGSPEFASVMGAWGYSEIISTVAIAFVMHTLLRHTRWGLHTQAAGANALGASEAGIHVNRLRLGNFILAAVLAGFTGILEGFRITSIDPQAGGN